MIIHLFSESYGDISGLSHLGKPTEIVEAPRLIDDAGMMMIIIISFAYVCCFRPVATASRCCNHSNWLGHFEYCLHSHRFSCYFFDIAGCPAILRLQFLIFNARVLYFGRLFGGTELGLSRNTRSPSQQNLVVEGCMQLSVFTSLKWQNV